MENYPEAIITVNGKKYEADLLVFDKDGLMFDSEQFWVELANARMRVLTAHFSASEILSWAALMGVRTEIDGEKITAADIDPTGILAVASPEEEMTLLAGFLVSRTGMIWNEARHLARDLFDRADRDIDLKRALKPQPGFIDLMRRLGELNIPYGVATSDTYARTRESMSMFGCWENVRFVVTPTDVAKGKPEPDMLQLISEKQHVPAERIVMLGDSYVDVKMADAAGSIGIGITPDKAMQQKMEPFATEIVSSLEKITVDQGYRGGINYGKNDIRH